MKVALSANGRDLDAQIDPRFGRCAYFIIVDTDDMGFEAFDNESIALGGGAGIQAAQFVVSKGAKIVITGQCGPNAVRTLSATDVELFTGQTGTVREAVGRYINGELRSSTDSDRSDFQGMGRGMGCGRGMGGGKQAGRWGSQNKIGSTSLSKEEELRSLKDQANALRDQVDAIESRIKNLDKE